MDLIGQIVVEEKLRCELIGLVVGALGSNRKMDVYRPAGIPAGINRDELNSTVGIRNLVAAQKFLTGGIEALIGYTGINSLSITLPDVHLCTLDG